MRDSKWQATSRIVPSGSNRTRFTVWQQGHGTATLASSLESGDIGPPEQLTVALTV
jgi:hypothetical protein